MKENKLIEIGILVIIIVTIPSIIIKSVERNKSKENINAVLVEKVLTENNITKNSTLEDKDKIEFEKEINENKEQKSIIVLKKAKGNSYEEALDIDNIETYDSISIKEFNSIPNSIIGQWQIEKLYAESWINTYTDEEIKEIIGVKILYTKDLAVINGHKYPNPRYSIDYLDTRYFDNKLKKDLNITKDKIKIITIKTSDSQFIYGLGGHVVIMEEQPYLYDGGEFFKLVRC